MKVTAENLSEIEWGSITIENVGGVQILVLVCSTVEQSMKLFLLLKFNNYVITMDKENGKDCFVLLFDEYELWFEPEKNYPNMDKVKDGTVTKITTGFVDELGDTKVNIEVLKLKRHNFNFSLN